MSTWQTAIEPLRPDRPPFLLSELDDTPPWDPDSAALNLLVRAPLAHVGLGALDVFVEFWTGDTKTHGMPDAIKRRPDFAPPLWFDSIFDGLCVFGVEEDELKHRPQVLYALGVAVVAALFTHHGVPPESHPAGWEEAAQAVDILGLGALIRST